jgi:hypothetical protein
MIASVVLLTETGLLLNNKSFVMELYLILLGFPMILALGNIKTSPMRATFPSHFTLQV